MIHILTSHVFDDTWIDLQIDHIKKHTKEPFKIYSIYDCVSVEEFDKHKHKWDYAEQLTKNELSLEMQDPLGHPYKLHYLVDVMAKDADLENDWLVFLDGDAWPISDDWISHLTSKAKDHVVCSLKRLENDGECRPGSPFLICQPKFWIENKLTWYPEGCYYIDTNGRKVKDVGCKLMHQLQDLNVDWYPLLRSNKKNFHRLWFGIYDNIIYHHSKGFGRNPEECKTQERDAWYVSYLDMQENPGKSFKEIGMKNKKLSDEWYELLKQNPEEFYNKLRGI
jgi:hypothetical protein